MTHRDSTPADPLGQAQNSTAAGNPVAPNPPAFPQDPHRYINSGMDLRDYFAAHVQADDRLVKCIRAMDDSALEIFALYPAFEREEHITELELTAWLSLPSEVAKITRRLELEAWAIARVRFMQADAMLAARLAPPVDTKGGR